MSACSRTPHVLHPKRNIAPRSTALELTPSQAVKNGRKSSIAVSIRSRRPVSAPITAQGEKKTVESTHM